MSKKTHNLIPIRSFQSHHQLERVMVEIKINNGRKNGGLKPPYKMKIKSSMRVACGAFDSFAHYISIYATTTSWSRLNKSRRHLCHSHLRIINCMYLLIFAQQQHFCHILHLVIIRCVLLFCIHSTSFLFHLFRGIFFNL